MRNVLLLLLLFLAHFSASAQAYLGRVAGSATVNMREGPGTGYGVVKSLKNGAQLFISSSETENGFYNVIDIASNTEGYVHKSLVHLGEPVAASADGIFNREGESGSLESVVEVYNRTEKSLTLKLNTATYHFAPYQRQTITLAANSYSYRASAPGVIPYFGTDRIEAGSSYSWEFYIVQSYR